MNTAQNKDDQRQENRDNLSRGEKAANTAKLRYGEDFHRAIGEKGGKAADHEKAVQTTKERHGENFYREIGHEGGKAGGKARSDQSANDEGRDSEGQRKVG